MSAIYLITGIQAAGKSTVAQALAQRLPGPSVHVHGDQFRRWIVHGRLDLTSDAGQDALAQLQLRHELTAATCDRYAASGSRPGRHSRPAPAAQSQSGVSATSRSVCAQVASNAVRSGDERGGEIAGERPDLGAG